MTVTATGAGVGPSVVPGTGRPSLRRSVGRAFAILAVAIAVATGVTAWLFARQVDARHRVVDVIDPARIDAQVLLSTYVDEETGVRGYALTGATEFLQPYQQGLGVAPAQLRAVAAHLPAGSRGAALLATVEARAAAWSGRFAAPTVAAAMRGDRSVASTATQTYGKQLFDSLRASFATLDAELVAERTAATTRLDHATLAVEIELCCLVALLGALGVTAWYALRRRVIVPLARVGADVRAVSSGELERPVAGSGPAEIVALAADVERMRVRILGDLREVEVARNGLEDANGRLDAANRDLARSNVELEQFAYVASHDLQEPLRKVTGFTQLLQRRYQGQLDAKADEYIAFATDGAVRMQVLINDLLAFSRVGRTNEDFEPVDLNPVFTAAASSLSQAIEDAGATVTATPLPTVLGARSLLTALLQNLIANAMKFHSDAPPRIEVRCEDQGEEWLLSVEDNGIGIEPRFAERVFVIFQRLHGKDQYPGTGIGLAMCRKIVEHHGGRIWVDTDHSGGTKMCWTLPKSTLPKSTLPKAEHP